jgi:hypothetical protein
MEKNTIESIKSKLKGLRQYANYSDEDLEKVATERYNRDGLLNKLSFVADGEEKTYALKLFDNYLSEYELESSADKDTLCQLVDLEMLGYRLKKQIDEICKGTETSKGQIPYRLVELLHQNTEQISKLKSLLGMCKEEKDKSASDFVRAEESKKKRFEDWINLPENRANYTYVCDHCKGWNLIRRRIDKEKDAVLKSPWFIYGGILFNKGIFEDLYSGLITVEQVCKYLGNVPKDYIDWIFKHYRIEIGMKTEEPERKIDSETEKEKEE